MTSVYRDRMEVKGRRGYDTSNRRSDTQQRRRAVMAAALSLLIETSYPATTIAAIARSAGVSVEFVYKTFKDKPSLVRELVDVTLAGDDEPVAMADRAAAQRMRAEPDPAQVLRLYAELCASVNARVAPLLLVIAESPDTQLAEIWRTTRGQHRIGIGRMLEDVAAKGSLRVPMAEAVDLVWATAGPQLHRQLVRECSWPPERYARFLAESWTAQLL